MNVLDKIKPQISVIVPVYNLECNLKLCIESIIGQTYDNLQIILVDDGSTDNSGEICNGYAELDNRIQVVHKINGGVVTARQSGLDLATGSYIGFVDGDDYIEPTFYENLLYKMLEMSVDFVHSGFITEGNGKHNICAPLYERVITSKADRLSLIKKYVLYLENENEIWSPSMWSKLFKANFIRKVHNYVPENQSYGEDLLAFCRCILESDKFALITNAEYHYILRDGSLSHRQNIKKFREESNLYNGLCSIWKEYGYYEEMEEFMDKYLFIRLSNCMNQVNKIGLGVTEYVVSDINMLEGKRVIIYGAGKVGKSYLSQLLTVRNCIVLGWTDRDFKSGSHIICVSRERLKEISYDVILIAVKSILTASEIKEDLIELGVDEKKILWMKPKLNLNMY